MITLREIGRDDLPVINRWRRDPVVADGVMYISTGSPGTVVALDLKSGRPLWEWTRPMPDTVHNLGFPRANRGVAILDGTVYVGTLDCYLVALDARSGVKRWEVHVGENDSGHSITGAPLAVDGKIIVGVSGGEAGIRGFLDAYDAKSGTRLWRFWTVPTRGEKGNDTWEGESWKDRLGVNAWPFYFTLDEQRGLVYLPLASPIGGFYGGDRKGANLFGNSVVAVDIQTGAYRSHFQTIHHDLWDHDPPAPPGLFASATVTSPL